MNSQRLPPNSTNCPEPSLPRASDQPAKTFCLPLVTEDEIRKPFWCCFATATFAFVGESFFLVSAAHSIQHMNEKPILLPHDPAPINLANHGFVKDERADVAAAKLNLGVIDQLGDRVIFVTPELVNTNAPAQSDRISTVRGFPSSRNKMKTRFHRIGERGLNFNTFDISDSFFPDEEYDSKVHFALAYPKRGILDDNFKKTSRPEMFGASGGPITETFFFGKIQIFRIQGILLARKLKKRALVGLRYEYIMEWIKDNLGRFPEPPR